MEYFANTEKSSKFATKLEKISNEEDLLKPAITLLHVLL